MDDFSDIWPQWADLSHRFAYQVEQEHAVSRDVLAGLDPLRSSSCCLMWRLGHA